MKQLESFSQNKAEGGKIDQEKIFLARNFIQLYYAQKKTGLSAGLYSPNKEDNDHLAEEAEKFGSEFHDWLDSVDGKAVVEEYAKSHTLEKIGMFNDMDKIISAYEAYRTRTLH